MIIKTPCRQITRSVEESYWLKRLDTANLKLTKIQDNLLRQQIRKHSKKMMLVSPSSLLNIELNYIHIFNL